MQMLSVGTAELTRDLGKGQNHTSFVVTCIIPLCIATYIDWYTAVENL
jgi:hypothetical protein